MLTDNGNRYAKLSLGCSEVTSFIVGSDLSKTVATFIVQKILQDELGLEYICQTGERFFAVSSVLNNMISTQAEKPDLRLLKHIFRCYSRLLEHPNAREALKTHNGNELNECLSDANIRIFENVLADDPATKTWLKQLLLVIRS